MSERFHSTTRSKSDSGDGHRRHFVQHARSTSRCRIWVLFNVVRCLAFIRSSANRAFRVGVFLTAWTIQHSFWSFLFTCVLTARQTRPFICAYCSYGIMFGLGQGIAYVIAVSCVINWAPQAVGFCSGIVAAGFGISSSIFAPIQTRLINQENLPATHDG